MNLLLHGIDDFAIVQDDTLRQPAFSDPATGGLATYDCVLANPPFSLEQWGREVRESDLWGRAITGLPTDSSSDFDFVQHMLKSIAPITGCMAVLVKVPERVATICTDIVISVAGKERDNKRYAPTKRDSQEKLLDRLCDPNDPLQILIVTAKLLTSFDAPILQAIYLDKLLRDHTLLQAICRTNRTYGDKKSCGLIVDYLAFFVDRKPANATVAVNFDGKEDHITPLFVSVTANTRLTDHNGVTPPGDTD